MSQPTCMHQRRERREFTRQRRWGWLCRRRQGGTLIELLLVVGIIALLMQLLFPAVNAARGSARRMVCVSKLRELASAMIVHHDALDRFPSGGWHYTWIGEPERGTGPNQPGGWAFNLLDYLQRGELRSMGRATLDGPTRFDAFASRCQAPLSEFICPERRDVQAYPQRWNQQPFTLGGRAAGVLNMAAKSDYAVNVGDSDTCEFPSTWVGPESLREGDLPGFVWPSVDEFTGVVFARSSIGQVDIRDGMSKTYLIGEKYVDVNHYESGEDWGDNENLYAGFNNDNGRSTKGTPQPDQPGVDHRNQFGGPHRSVWQAAMCDGSVQSVGFDIDQEVHRRRGNRSDVNATLHDTQNPPWRVKGRFGALTRE